MFSIFSPFCVSWIFEQHIINNDIRTFSGLNILANNNLGKWYLHIPSTASAYCHPLKFFSLQKSQKFKIEHFNFFPLNVTYLAYFWFFLMFNHIFFRYLCVQPTKLFNINLLNIFFPFKRVFGEWNFVFFCCSLPQKLFLNKRSKQTNSRHFYC